ncbi:hypothetical protein BDF14DRAFT_1779110 [Spinellus fusiger]|nr:hypothetical protein BDF14DRAFT_1779110 [Spinellus fusiger]
MVYYSEEPSTPIPVISSYDMLFENRFNIPMDQKIYIDNENVNNFLTYGGLKEQITLFSSGLQQIFNLQRGDVVSICAPNIIDYAVPFHGTLAAGGIVNPVEYKLSTQSLIYDLSVTKPKIIIAHRVNLKNCIEAAEFLKIPKSHILLFGNKKLRGVVPYKHILYSYGVTMPPVKYTKEQIMKDTSYLYFTSGTTGAKKATMLSQYNVTSCLFIEDLWGKMQGRAMIGMNYHHASALVFTLYHAIFCGVEYHILTGHDLATVSRSIEKYKIKTFMCPPFCAINLLKDPISKKYDHSSLEIFICTGSKMDVHSMKEFNKRFNVTVVNKFAMTENTCCFKLTAETIENGSIGIIQNGNTMKLVDMDGQEITNEEPGQLCIKGPTTAMGYYRNPEKTAEMFDSDGFMLTGDIFRREKSGLFYYVDREKDLIKNNLYKICPSEIENFLMTLKEIAECSVVAVIDDGKELARGVIKLAPGVEKSEKLAQEIIEHVRNNMNPEFSLFGGIEFIDTFPRTASGKIIRRIVVGNAQKNLDLIKEAQSV